MRQLELPAGQPPRAWGQIHGETFRGEIQALAAIRIYLCTRVGGFKSAAEVCVAASAHLPVLERYHRGLYDELIGIAEGAAVSPEDIVVANHYTDLRDLDPDPGTWRPAPLADDAGAGAGAAGEERGGQDSQASTEPSGAGPRDATRGGVNGPALPGQRGRERPLSEDGCSVIWAESPTGRILAQTWDMHATAIPYVMLLRVPDSADGPPATLLSVTGCLGMAGMNAARVAIAINNLYSTDATLGVVWPAVVRRALHRRTAALARDAIATAPIGSGHHYFVADRRHAFAIEASGTRRKQVFAGGPAFCHTNHCLDGDVAARSKVPPTSTTHDRMRWLEADLARAPIADLADAWHRLGSEDGWPRSVCTNLATPESPHGAATCGAIAMNLSTGELWAQQGLVHNVAAERWQV
jgi:isopenicillin-N N-acyltransferase-like protein